MNERDTDTALHELFAAALAETPDAEAMTARILTRLHARERLRMLILTPLLVAIGATATLAAVPAIEALGATLTDLALAAPLAWPWVSQTVSSSALAIGGAAIALWLGLLTESS